ncbi:MAG: lipase family protein, partial [Solirubrobacterales bacterium]
MAEEKRHRLRDGLLVAAAAIAALVLTLVLVLAISGSTGSVDTSAAGPFYEAPDPLPEGEPGAVIRSEPTAIPAAVKAPAGARSRRVLYLTTDPQTGRHRVASGTVMTPPGKAPADGRPVLAWAHATIGVAPKCAPSLDRTPAPATVPGLGEFLRRGWTVASTDYPGLGTEGPNAYLVGNVEGRAVLDAARAARALEPGGTSAKTVVWGHSQGGQAALFAGQEAARYAPDLDLLGVAAAAPAVELKELLDLDGKTINGLVLGSMVLWSWPKTVPGVSLDGLVGAEGRRLADAIASRCLKGQASLTRDLAAAELEKLSRSVEIEELAGDPGWARALAQNTPQASGSGAPLYIAQGTADPLVRPQTTASYFRRLCRAGRQARLVLMPGVGHVKAGEAGAAGAVAWAQALRAGDAGPPGCRVTRA